MRRTLAQLLALATMVIILLVAVLFAWLLNR